jgi:probable phosphoglycerate mutase
VKPGTRIVLVRHGESQAQAQGFVGGHNACRGLSALGVRQVEALRDRWLATDELGDEPILYASIMPRAVETATILAPAVGDGEVAITQDCGLCEHHPGEADGLSMADYAERYPYPDTGWDPQLRRAPGSESWQEMADRVSAAFDRLVDEHAGRTVVVASHGGVIVQLMIRLLGLDPGRDGERAWLACGNASISEFSRVAKRYAPHEGVWELSRYNDRAHLAGVRRR